MYLINTKEYRLIGSNKFYLISIDVRLEVLDEEGTELEIDKMYRYVQ